MPGFQQALQHLTLTRIDMALRRPQPELRLRGGIQHNGLTGHARLCKSLHKRSNALASAEVSNFSCGHALCCQM
jgi:hypothetical protein